MGSRSGLKRIRSCRRRACAARFGLSWQRQRVAHQRMPQGSSCAVSRNSHKDQLVVCRSVTITSRYASKLIWQQTVKPFSPATNVRNSVALPNRVPRLRATCSRHLHLGLRPGSQTPPLHQCLLCQPSPKPVEIFQPFPPATY